MTIEITLDKDFERFLDQLRIKYGEQFEYINGVHPSQLNYSVFMDKFKEHEALADNSIDPNANSRNKDLRSFISEKNKPYDKLFGLSKTFLEIKKKWGLRTAKAWFEQEYSRGFYLNDASASSSYFPYCVKGTELLKVRQGDEESLITFQDLWASLEAEAHPMLDGQTLSKSTSGIQVFDGSQWTDISCMTRTPAQTKTLRYIKLANGMALSVTNDHTMVTSQGEKKAKDIQPGDVIYTEKPVLNYPTNAYIYCAAELKRIGVLDTLSYARLGGLSIDSSTDLEQEASFSFARDCSYFPNKLKLDADLGYLLGIWLAEGYSQGNRLRIIQNWGPQLQRIVDICEKKHLSYACHSRSGENMQLYIGSPQLYQVFTTLFTGGYKAQEKRLSSFVFSRTNREFILGIIGGLIDGDGYITPNNQHGVEFHSTSRALVNQIAYVLRAEGYTVREKLHHASAPREYQGRKIESKSNGYCIYFACPADVEDFSSDKVRERRSAEAGYFYDPTQAESKYTFNYGDQKVLSNVEEPIQRDDYVYDITTGTHKFLCNGIQTHNCYAVDLTRLATEGLFFLKDYNAEAPQHLTTFLEDVIEFVSFLSNRQSGAVGLPNIIIWMYYFWKKDCKSGNFIHDPDYYLKQCFQKLIYRLNQPFLRIDQSAFTNVSIFDRYYIEALFGGLEFPDGSFAVDEIDEIIECQKVFMEVVSEIRHQQMFTFPVLTFSLLYKDGKFQDEEFARWCSDHNTEWMDSNFFISDNVGVLSNCCRLLSDTSKLEGFVNSIGGTALSIGSARVSTINLARIAYESKFNKKKYLSILADRVTLDCKALYSMRHIIQRNIEKGLLPNYQEGALELSKQYMTVGILGLYEVMDLFGLINTDELGYKSYSDEAIQFATEIFDTINSIKDNFTDEFTFNVESIPGENCAGTICQADNLLFEQDKYYIYSNQWIPLREKCTIQEKCRLSSILDAKCSGGAIAHINIEGRFASKEAAWEMLQYVAKSGVIYSAFNTKISVCKHHHAFIGTETCPECGEPVADKFTRVVGFYTPVSGYQKIRRREFDERKWYSLSDSING